MKLEDQVVSLELAKHLKELGVKQESLFYWIERTGYPNGLLVYAKSEGAAAYQGKICASAFTVAELGEMLPDSGLDAIHRTMGGTWACYRNKGNNKDEEINEADARANMLIYFVEEGLVKP